MIALEPGETIEIPYGRKRYKVQCLNLRQQRKLAKVRRDSFAAIEVSNPEAAAIALEETLKEALPNLSDEEFEKFMETVDTDAACLIVRTLMGELTDDERKKLEPAHSSQPASCVVDAEPAATACQGSCR